MEHLRCNILRRLAVVGPHHCIGVNAIEVRIVQLGEMARVALSRLDELTFIHCYGYNWRGARKVTVAKLLDYLERAARLDAEFIVHDDGYRGRSYRYSEIAKMADALRARLHAADVAK